MAQENWWEAAPVVQQQGPLPSPPERPKEPPAPKTSYRTLKPEEATARGLPPGKVYQESSEGKIDALAGAGENPGDTKEVMRSANLDSIIAQINRVQQLYDSGIRDETLSNAFGALDSLGPTAGQFDAAGQAIADQGLAAFRVPGVGAQSDMEAKQFALANTPQSGNWDVAIEEKLRTMRARVDANRKALGLPPATWEGVEQQPVAGAAGGGDGDAPPAPPPVGGAPPQNAAEAGLTPGGPGGASATLATDAKTVADPLMAGVAAAYRKRLAANPSPSEMVAWLESVGVTSPETLAQARAQASYRRRFPQVPLDQYSITADRDVPLSAVEKTMSTVGQSADTDAGAAALAAGNLFSGNNIDSLSGAMGGSAERTRAGMEEIAERHPKSTFAGETAGGVLGALGIQSGLSRVGVRAAPVVADMLMGAANGAGMADDGNRALGAAKGAGAAYVGSKVGSKLTRSLVSPTGGDMAALYGLGVRPTIGQRFANVNGGKGVTGMVGKTINAAEEALQSVPVVGSAIRGARQDARDQVQLGAFNEALKEIGEQLPKGTKVGTDPHKFAQKAFDVVYDTARSGMTMVADQGLATDLSALAPDIATLGPAQRARLKSIMDNVVNNRVGNGAMDGEAYKKAVSGLGKRAERLQKSLMAEDQELGEVLLGVQSALDAAARRHSSSDAVRLLDAADAGYAKLVRIEMAAARRGGDAGTFSPAGLDASVQKASGRVRSKAYLRGDALMQDIATAGRGLEDTLPNSGTADRVMAGYAVGAPAAATAAYLDPTALAVLGTIAAAYAPGVRKAVTGIMAPRGGEKTKAIAEKLARIAGSGAAATSVAALPGTALAP